MFEGLKEIGYITIKKTVKENKNRMRILKLILKKPLKISDIREELNLNYKTVWEHVKVLEKQGLVGLDQQENVAGKPVFVKIKDQELVSILFMSEKELNKVLERKDVQ